MNERRFLWSKFIWNMFDFAVDHRNEGAQPGLNDKGLVTHDRKIKKDAFFWYKANWSTEPVLYITSRRWTERTQSPAPVKVYSNLDSVELKVNGVSQGTKACRDHIGQWDAVALKPGANRIEVLGARDGKTYTDQCVWNYTETARIHSVSSESEPVNGADKVVDGNPRDESRWSTEGFPQQVILDYGRIKSFQRIRVWTYQGRDYQYIVEISSQPDSGYKTIVDRCVNPGGAQPFIDTFSPVDGRYLRLTITGAGKYTGNWSAITEISAD